MSIVPREIRAGADVITVGRAWPRSVSTGVTPSSSS